MTPRRLIIADPGLTGPAGHHLGYSQAVAEAALRRGIAPVVLAGRTFSGTIAGGAIPVTPFFAARYHGAGGGGALRRTVFGAAAYMPRPFAGMVAPPLRALRRRLSRRAAPDRMGGELAAALVALGAGSDDAALLHSVSSAHLYGINHSLPRRAVGHFFIVLRRTREEMDLDDAAPVSVCSLLQSLAERCGAGFRLFADSPPLADRWAVETGLSVAPLPIPVGVPSVPEQLPVDLPHVVFPGGARLEKGYQHLPASIRASASRAQFTIHSGPVGPCEDPLVQKTHRALRRLSGPRLALLEDNLEPGAYLALLASADLLFLPYDGVCYGPRSSGILAEALALGLPSVVPAGCWMAEMAGQDRAVAIGPRTPPANALLDALARLPALSAAARAGAPLWRSVHNPNALLAALLGELSLPTA